MSAQRIVTHGGHDNRFKLCRCNGCKRVAVCTPDRDFYTRDGDPRGPLYCFGCLMSVGPKTPTTPMLAHTRKRKPS